MHTVKVMRHVTSSKFTAFIFEGLVEVELSTLQGENVSAVYYIFF